MSVKHKPTSKESNNNHLLGVDKNKKEECA